MIPTMILATPILATPSILKEHTMSRVARALVAASLLLAVCGHVKGATINLGTINLLPNTANQTVAVTITGTDTNVVGLDFYAVVGDGGPQLVDWGLPAGTPAPGFVNLPANVNITGAGTIFAGNNGGAFDLFAPNGPPGSLPQAAAYETTTLSPTNPVTDNGTLAFPLSARSGSAVARGRWLSMTPPWAAPIIRTWCYKATGLSFQRSSVARSRSCPSRRPWFWLSSVSSHFLVRPGGCDVATWRNSAEAPPPTAQMCEYCARAWRSVLDDALSSFTEALIAFVDMHPLCDVVRAVKELHVRSKSRRSFRRFRVWPTP